jgi:hypothetical protein
MQKGAGKALVAVARQPLDADGQPFGKPLLYTGKLLTVTPGDTDSNSTAAQLWQIVVSTEGEVG